MARPGVDTLSEVSWLRVERQLFAAVDRERSGPHAIAPARRRSPAGWALAAAVVTATAAVAMFVWPSPATSRAPRAADAPGLSRVVTQDAPSRVGFGEATVTVGARSAVTMHGDAERGVLIVLERGEASFAVAPRGNRPPFVVQAGEVMVRVLGTRFTVARDGDAARIDVAEGTVEVVAGDLRVEVGAGGSWSSTDADPQGRFDHAATLETRDPTAALAGYRTVADGHDAWAMNALFAAGRLAVELHDPEAAGLLGDYLRRFPDGPNAADAHLLLDSLGQ